MRPDIEEIRLATVPIASVADEDLARADFYALLAALLARPPDAALLAGLAAAPPLAASNPALAFPRAWKALLDAAAVHEPASVRDEFDALFVSIGTPALNPYASFYLAGFMNSQPLAALRTDLARLGLARAGGVGEPEDHLAALCEVMRALIMGVAGAGPQALAVQRRFFLDHLAPWYRRGLEDMRNAEGASFYRTVADFGLAFFDLEFEAFEMEDAFDIRHDMGHDMAWQEEH